MEQRLGSKGPSRSTHGQFLARFVAHCESCAQDIKAVFFFFFCVIRVWGCRVF